MQNNNILDFQVLNGDGKTFTSLSYPRNTRVWQVIQDVKQQITTKAHACVILRSSLGTILQPHKRLDRVLNAPEGDYVVVDCVEPSAIEVKNSLGHHTNYTATERNMKQSGFDKPMSRRPIRDPNVIEEKDVRSARGNCYRGNSTTEWGNYKIPLRKHPYNRQPKRLLQSDSKEGLGSLPCSSTETQYANHRPESETLDVDNCYSKTIMQRTGRKGDDVDGAILTVLDASKRDCDSVVDCKTRDTDPMLSTTQVKQKAKQTTKREREKTDGDHKMTRIVKQKSNSEETTISDLKTSPSALGDLMRNYGDDSEEEDEGMEIKDVYGSTWKVIEQTSKTDRNIKKDVTNATSKWKTSDRANSKDQNEPVSKSSDMVSSVISSFSSGVGTFLQSLKSESQKQNLYSSMQTPNRNTKCGILKNASILSDPIKEWPKRSMRTYTRQTRTLHHQYVPSVTSLPNANSISDKLQDSQTLAGDDALEDDTEAASSSNTQHEKKCEMKSRTTVNTSPISSKTRGSSLRVITEAENKEDENVEMKEEGNEDLWQKDVILLSIKCKGPISNKQLASCINGILLDLEEEDTKVLQALTVDEIQKKLESIYQRDLSNKRKLIEYVFLKLKKEGTKKQKASSPIVVTIGEINLTRTDLYTLAENAWLNDNIINSYFHLLTEISKKKVFAFSTFFYRALTHKSENVKRWTDKIDIFSQDLVLVPVHLRNHWTLAAIHVQQHRIEYYNSLGSNNPKCCGILIQYLRKEATNRQCHLFTALNWETGMMKGLPQQQNGSDCGVYICQVSGLPQQQNGSDCGVYICQYAKRLCLQKPVKFTSLEAFRFRKKMVNELINAELDVS